MRTLVTNVALGLALGVVLAAARSAADDSALMFVGDFERGGMQRFGDSQREHTLQKVEIVSSPIRHGAQALKLVLDREAHRDKKGHRTDFWIRGMSRSFRMGQDYWYGFSTYWPGTWRADTQSELFVQWIPVERGSGGPALAIYVYGEQYRIKKRWSAEASAYRNLWRGDVAADRGTWIDWVFHVKWSPTEDGTVQVWRNGKKIVSDTGRNSGPGEYAPYFKFGIYKWPWKQDSEAAPSTVSRRVLYFDEIRIGNSETGFEAVSPPRQGAPLAEPRPGD